MIKIEDFHWKVHHSYGEKFQGIVQDPSISTQWLFWYIGPHMNLLSKDKLV